MPILESYVVEVTTKVVIRKVSGTEESVVEEFIVRDLASATNSSSRPNRHITSVVDALTTKLGERASNHAKVTEANERERLS